MWTLYGESLMARNPHRVIPGRCAASNYDVQLHIGESRDSRCAIAHLRSGPSDHPRMTAPASMRQNLRQELLRAFAARTAEEIGLQRILDDLALVHEDHAIRDLAGKAHFVGDDHHGHALMGEIDH